MLRMEWLFVARFNRHVLVALGVHDFENDELVALGAQTDGLSVVFCPTEAELSVTLLQSVPDAICLSAGWSTERLQAALHQLAPRSENRIPLFLCGPASELELSANGALEIHRVCGLAPSAEILEQALRRPSAAGSSTLSEEDAPRCGEDQPFLFAPLEHASLPRFIGGIAHDFNNLLAAIIGDVQLAASRTSDPVVGKHLHRANEACFRMSGEIRRLLAFQEGTKERRGLVELSQVFRDSSRHIQNLLGTGVEVETVECTEPLWVEGTISGLQQILLNLVTYAAQQVMACRLIRIGMRRHDDDEIPYAPGARLQRPACALIEVEIRGEDAVVPSGLKSYEPVFSRPVRDAGVSLAIVWKLVQDFDGSVSVLHGRHGSAAFRVQLPLAHPSPMAPAEQLTALRGTERLVMASTDRSSMESLSRDMRGFGYDVCVVTDIPALANAVAQTASRPACVLIDTDCDHFDAALAHNTVRGFDARLPILLAAPELAPLSHPPYSTDGLTCLVHKPLDIKEVLSTVRALCSRPALHPSFSG